MGTASEGGEGGELDAEVVGGSVEQNQQKYFDEKRRHLKWQEHILTSDASWA